MNVSIQQKVHEWDKRRIEADSERIGGSALSQGDFVAVRWWDNRANPVGWQHKIVKVKQVLSDGIIDETDKVWRKGKSPKGCVHGHATMRPPSLMEFLCNSVQWEIREIFWD